MRRRGSAGWLDCERTSANAGATRAAQGWSGGWLARCLRNPVRGQREDHHWSMHVPACSAEWERSAPHKRRSHRAGGESLHLLSRHRVPAIQPHRQLTVEGWRACRQEPRLRAGTLFASAVDRSLPAPCFQNYEPEPRSVPGCASASHAISSPNSVLAHANQERVNFSGSSLK